MFYTLHRVVKGLVYLALLAGLYWVWQQRAALEPVYVWYDVYKNDGIERTEPLPRIFGKGLHIVDGHTFKIASNKNVYSVRLTGFEVPEPPLSAEEIEVEKARRDFLRSAIVSNIVHVEVTYSNVNSLLGVVSVGKTNLNIHYITNNLSRFNREYIKTMPRRVQYEFFAAARVHRRLKEARESALAAAN